VNSLADAGFTMWSCVETIDRIGAFTRAAAAAIEPASPAVTSPRPMGSGSDWATCGFSS